MRHAVRVLALAACLLPLCRPAPVGAQEGPPERINGIGLIDFGMRPTFKVGSWAKYHMSAKSDLGVSDDYNLTVLIGGEEHWWGEDCFWIETWTESPVTGTQAVASLMSFDVFGDSLALSHMQLYVRKIINGIKEDGTAEQLIYKRPVSTIVTREPVGSQFKLLVDTLGKETVTVRKGTYDCTKLRFFQGRSATGAKGDSTDYTELKETRTTFLNPKVPISHIVREDIERSFTRKVWLVGHSKEALPTMTLDRTVGSAELVDFGDGLAARLVPLEVRKNLAEQRANAPKPPTPAKPPARKKAG